MYRINETHKRRTQMVGEIKLCVFMHSSLFQLETITFDWKPTQFMIYSHA